MWAHNYGGLELVRAITVTTNSNGLYADLGTYASLAKREVLAFISLGAFTTTTTATVAITESDASGSGFAAPANGTASTAYTTAGLKTMSFRIDKRYVRAELTVDATGTIPCSVTLVAMKRTA